MGSTTQNAAPALLEAAQKGMASLCAIFGGQGPRNPNCLEDLFHVYEANQSFLEELIDVAASTISRLSTLPDTADFYEDFGFDIKKWLANPDSAPTKDYLATAPFSFPIITLISLAHYCVACRTLGISPREFRDSLRGVTGHSQGIIAAAVVARSDGWDKFYEATRSALVISFWIGYESHLATPSSLLPAAAVRDSEDRGEGRPSAMLSINGLNRTYIERLIREVNSQTPHEGHIYLALVNSREKTVVSGSPDTLRTLSLRLRKISASEGLDQRQIPFIHRKPVVHQQYLPISGAFHSPCLNAAVTQVLKAVESESWTGHDMGIALYHTRSGENLQQKGSANLIDTLVRAVTSDMVDWPKIYSQMDVSHLLDFGPGLASSLIHELSEGTGLRIIRMSEKSACSPHIGSRTDIFGQHMLPRPSSWADLYRPQLREYADGSAQLDTKMTRTFGAPPVMVAGMTPTTVPWDFVAAVMKAGYHIELAGGGYSKPKDFEDAIKKIHATLPIGRGITCNLIYVNPRQLAWQVPLLRRLNRDGIQIDGLTIGAGIPSAEVVKEYVETIGLKHISFKPGSYESILQVISIAQGYPNFPIGLQWTGGRAGGHHSFEDFHEPLLKAYSRIRQCPNIILIAGSGFGGADDTFPYLTGEWARFLGYPLMPIDGILLGSRMMVAREAHTSPQVKALVVQAEGLDDSEWFKTYETSSGGFVTVNSEMGHPIHMLATRGTMLWKDLENRIFAIKDPAERLRMLRRNRADIVKRLNRDFAKPWFAVKSTGECVELQDMTYLEVFYRLVALMYVRHQQRWIHSSYLTLVLDFMKRVQERLAAVAELIPHGLNDPYKLLTQFKRCYPTAEAELLYPEDVSYLMGIFRRHGQKPVNFIPKLDENFETWFKKDSLWQAEDLDAVPGQDVQRICIIHGPVAARHSKVADESAETILNAINQRHIEMLRRTFQANQNVVPNKAIHDSLMPQPMPKIGNIYVEEQDMQKRYELGSTGILPELGALVERVLESSRGWLHACFTDEFICRGPKSLPNPISSAFKPGHGDIIVVKYHKNRQIQEIMLFTGSPPDHSPIREALKLSSYNGKNVTVTMSVPIPMSSRTATISFAFEFRQEVRQYRLHEESHRRNERIKEFYAGLWNVGLPDSLKATGLTSEFPGETITISKDVVTEFMNAVKKSDLSPSASWSSKMYVPIDICIFVAWTALVKPLLISAIDVDLLSLLHRSNSFKYYPGVRRLKIGDVLQSSSRIGAVTIQATGKLIEVVAEIKRNHEAVVKVTSVFFIQGQFSDYERTFRSTQDPVMIISVTSEVLQALILSRNWLIFDESASSLIGRTFSFRTTTHTTYKKGSSLHELKVDGQIFTSMGKDTSRCVGRVYFEGELCNGNPVMDFLTRHGSPRRQKQMLKSPGSNEESSHKIRIPRRSVAYSKSSKDTNPIHVCPVFAGYCHLPGTVTHGMYTSAAVRRAVEKAVGDTDCVRFSQYYASFEGMVLPGDTLTVNWSHVAMIDGRMVLSIQAFNDQSNEKVLEAEAEIEQASTAYLFCGQGSQEKGMGMSLYGTSVTARAIWDRGDQYLRDIYGFSILQIVRDDPKTLTIYFGGKRGQKIRDNYLAMTQKPVSSGPDGIEKPILPGLTLQTTSYTFSDERGLLFSTQFSQPAIALMEIAEFEHLKSKGVVQDNARYAGHSLGEYSALGACTTFLSLENLVDLIFYRGLRMQNAVKRDEHGRTEYSMVAVNPSRVGKTFVQENFETVISLISSETQLLLEVVNHNVKRQQYVCAGHLRTLWMLGKVLDVLAHHPRPESMASEELLQLVRQNLAASRQLPPVIELERGFATIPLKGIDIPFHSTLLRGEIENYRQYLKGKLAMEYIEPEQFVGKFIPNVMGKPFSITKSYVKQVADVTGSRQLLRMLQEMA